MALSTISGTTGITDATITSAKLADFAAAVDLNGVELILDADQDTSITADTDDRIDFKIAGVEHFSFSNSSGDTIIKPMVDAKDIKFQQFDGRTLLDINDGGFVGIANGATGPGEVRIFEDTDNGSNYVGLNAGSISSSFTLTLPTADGSSGQFLKTDGSGALSFDSVGAISSLDIDGGTDIGAGLADADLFIVDDGAGGTNRKTAASRIKTYIADVTLTTAAQTNITSLGTLTALTVDDVAVNGKVVTMTGSTDDTAVFTVATNGALTIETTDTAAAAANIQITADGTFEVDGSTITLDSAGDIILDAAGNDFNFKAGGTEVLRITNSSSDVVIKPTVDTKDIIFQQFDGTEVARIEDNATFNVSSAGKFAYAGTAVTSTAAELNILDGATATASEINLLDGDTSVGSSITLADADGFVVNDGGTMKTIPASDIKTYNPGGTAWQSVITSNTTMVAGRGYFVNTSGGAITMTLPSSASIGDTVQVIDYGATADTNNITIGRNSHKIQGDAADLTVSTERAAFSLVYVDATQGWLLDSK